MCPMCLCVSKKRPTTSKGKTYVPLCVYVFNKNALQSLKEKNLCATLCFKKQFKGKQ